MAKDTYIPRDEVVEIHRVFDKVRGTVEKELMKLPGVMAVGVGLKEIKGEVHRQPCFKITVEKKKAKTKIKTKDRIPENIYGIPTDVVEPITMSGANTAKYRPLIGGSRIEPSSASVDGTLGCFAKRNSDGKIVLLSN